MELTGTVMTGLGEGAHYVKRYNRYFLQKLGFEAFPGTLNLKVQEGPSLQNPLTITPEEKDLHPVECVPAIINNKLRGAVVRPQKTSHQKEVVEVIAPQSVKEALGVKDGDQVTVRFT